MRTPFHRATLCLKPTQPAVNPDDRGWDLTPAGHCALAEPDDTGSLALLDTDDYRDYDRGGVDRDATTRCRPNVAVRWTE